MGVRHDTLSGAHAGRRRLLAGGLMGGLLAGLGAAPAPARAQAMQQLLFGFPSGGPATALLDAFLAATARTGAEPPFAPAVRYLPGNGSRLAIDALRKSGAEAGQLLMAPSSVLTLLPLLAETRGDAVLRELAPVTPLAAFTFCLAVGPRVPASVRDMAGYKAWLVENPQQAVLGVPGVNTGAHLLGRHLGRYLGVALQFTSFQGSRPMLADLEAGAVPAAMVIVGSAQEAFAAGRLRGLMVTSDLRWPGVPDWPTARELGLGDVSLVETFGLYAHGDTPPSRLEVLAATARRALGEAALQQTVQRLGMRAMAPDITPEDFRFQLLSESQRWRSLLSSGQVASAR